MSGVKQPTDLRDFMKAMFNNITLRSLVFKGTSYVGGQSGTYKWSVLYLLWQGDFFVSIWVSEEKQAP